MSAKSELAITGTFSIIAMDPSSNQCGAAVASKYHGVGRVVPYVRAGVGAFCTQYAQVPKWGPIVLDRLAKGWSPQRILARLLEHDQDCGKRQLAVINMKGELAQHNPQTIGGQALWWGAMSGRWYVCQGNTLQGIYVVQAMALAYEQTGGSLADRLLAALLAGDAMGGDRRGRLAAGLKVAGGPGGDIELFVDESRQPVLDLQLQYDQR
ncbi:MAG: DUF1028 domain-containing protein [Kiritimatiellae bacterium]|nr:DUF1028 domain-containing protein [Kiritimatiellia bacterium]